MKVASLALAAGLLLTSTAWAQAHRVKQCGGTEPFWGLTLTSSTIRFQTASGERMTINRPTANSAQGRPSSFIALYQGRTLENPNRYMNVIIKAGECSDGMSDLVHPFSVLVLSGNTLYEGCCTAP